MILSSSSAIRHWARTAWAQSFRPALQTLVTAIDFCRPGLTASAFAAAGAAAAPDYVRAAQGVHAEKARLDRVLKPLLTPRLGARSAAIGVDGGEEGWFF